MSPSRPTAGAGKSSASLSTRETQVRPRGVATSHLPDARSGKTETGPPGAQRSRTRPAWQGARALSPVRELTPTCRRATEPHTTRASVRLNQGSCRMRRGPRVQRLSPAAAKHINQHFLKKTQSSECRRARGETATPAHRQWGCKLAQPLWDKARRFPKKINQGFLMTQQSHVRASAAWMPTSPRAILFTSAQREPR